MHDSKAAMLWLVDACVCQFDHKELAGRAFGIGAGGFDAFGGDATDGHGHGTHCCESLLTVHM